MLERARSTPGFVQSAVVAQGVYQREAAQAAAAVAAWARAHGQPLSVQLRWRAPPPLQMALPSPPPHHTPFFISSHSLGMQLPWL